MMYLLMVTWIYPQQPPQSYQIEFADEAKCLAARDAVYAQVLDLRQSALKFEKAKIEASGVAQQMGRLMVASVKTPDASAACVKR